MLIKNSNTNISSYNENIYNYNYIIHDLAPNEIISHEFYTNNYLRNVLIHYSFYNKDKVNLALTSDYFDSNEIQYIKVIDDNILEIRFNSILFGYYKFTLIFALLDDINNVKTFDQPCYLAKIISEDNNPNIVIKNVYGYSSNNDYLTTKINISSLKGSMDSRYVMNIMEEDFKGDSFRFNSALEFVPIKFLGIELYKINKFYFKTNNYFQYEHIDTKLKEFLLRWM